MSRGLQRGNKLRLEDDHKTSSAGHWEDPALMTAVGKMLRLKKSLQQPKAAQLMQGLSSLKINYNTASGYRGKHLLLT